jgi:23S rRNA-/tRNA-specific pseudouridylate synthase
VHRLDRDTSGVLLVARTAPALEALARQFRERSVQKRYLGDRSRPRHEGRGHDRRSPSAATRASASA